MDRSKSSPAPNDVSLGHKFCERLKLARSPYCERRTGRGEGRRASTDVQVFSAPNRVRVANLIEPTSDNELVAFHLPPNMVIHPPFSKAHTILTPTMNV